MMNSLIIVFYSLSLIIHTGVNEKEQSKDKVYTNLKKAVREKEDVKILNLYKKGYEEFPADIFVLNNLEVLNLSSNKIRKLPNNIDDLTSLKKLILVSDSLTSLPPEIGNMSNLIELNLMFNYITKLPKELGTLKNLKTLILHGNDIDNDDLKRITDQLPNCKIIIQFE